ncbi:MAG: asparagine synthase-related protein [Acidobacteria bacterium]|nr:asparagine synthase-related protein [Acidobacteriota bacterium]
MICGIWNRTAEAAERRDDLLGALPGRATDAFGRWADASVALGWRGRTFGEEGAESPRPDAASGLAITASVRLDGRDALCDVLDIPAPDRAALPDSALLLKSYARWGRACPEHLLGDFAFAVWDAKRDVLFCARDHVGTRPFYYAFTGERFVFGSSIAAVLAAPGVSGELDETVVATKLTFGARFLGAHTWYRAVRRLPPGHVLTVERGAGHLHRWWRPEEAPALPAASDDAYAEECLAIMTEAVRDRVGDSRRVGVHLSGGLDSSGVAVLAARELRRQGCPAPPAFAWYPPPGAGPHPVAGAYGALDPVCRREGLELFSRLPEVGDIVAFLRRDGALDGDTGVNEQIVRRRAAGLGVEALLSGWGGDEGISFNGRGLYPQLLRSGDVGRLWRELGERSRRPLRALVANAVLPAVAPGAARAVRALRCGDWPFRRNVTFIHPGFAKRVRPLPAGDRRRGGMLDARVHLLQSGRLSDRMEQWAVSGARHGIEYRYPLLDRRVLEFALGLPADQYRRGRWSRWLMRRALDPMLPPEVCWNRSQRDPHYASVRDVAAQAMVRVRAMIEGREGALSRGRYLDLPRLLQELDPERWRTSGRRTLKSVENALRFLDF